MEFGLKDKVAFVSGSSSGLGKAVAAELAAEGCRVAVSARRADVLSDTASEIREKTGADVYEAVGDLTRDEDVARTLEQTKSRLGPVDILVTNVGGPPPGRFQDVSMERWEEAFHLTLGHALKLIYHVLPGMKKSGWGRIINLTSVTVKQPVDTLILSNAMRAAVTGMAKTLSNEVAENGITVNNVLPGYTHTERLAELAADLAERQGCDEAEVFGNWEQAVPMKRLGEPAELAALVAFLASKRASYITGTSITVDGGLVKSLF